MELIMIRPKIVRPVNVRNRGLFIFFYYSGIGSCFLAFIVA